MNNFIVYTVEITFSLALFYIAYWLFLKNETFFKLNRFYLMASVVVSLSMPMLNITMTTQVGANSFISEYVILPVEQYEQRILGNIGSSNVLMGNNTSTIEDRGTAIRKKKSSHAMAVESNPAKTNRLQATESDNAEKEINWLTVLLLVYFTGAVLFLIRLLANFAWIYSYVLKHKTQLIGGMNVIRVEKDISPFSFLNFIVINRKDYPDAELTKIISHEKVHIKQKHSIDLILLELLLVFQWFNPLVWFYKRAIKITHEYLADHGALKSGVDLPSYQYSLLNQVLRDNNFEIASNYNLSIKKRITMMLKKRSSKLSVLKLAVALPILILMFSAFAFNPGSFKNNASTVERNKVVANTDTARKKVDVPVAYLKQIEGEYVSTNQPSFVRRIIFTEVMGTLYGNDNGYVYKLIPVGNGKFINPDDNESLEFDTRSGNTISLLLFGKINLNKVKLEKGPAKVPNKSLAFTVTKIIVKDGAEPALLFFKKAKDSTNYYFTESEMNYAGYILLGAGKAKEAAVIFKLNAKLFPNSFNVYDSYGEAMLVLGDKAGAIDNYKKSVKLNPGSKNGIKVLRELGVNTDSLIKIVKVSDAYLRSLEGTYLSTNQPTWVRKITFAVENGVLTGTDNGYRYGLIPMGEGKFINPDDGASLIFSTGNKNAITLSLFGTINLKKVKTSKEPALNLSVYAGEYLPSKNDTVLTSMEIQVDGDKLFRVIRSELSTPNGKLELEFVTEYTFFYTDNSFRSIEFILNNKKEVVGCFLRRPDGIHKLVKQK